MSASSTAARISSWEKWLWGGGPVALGKDAAGGHDLDEIGPVAGIDPAGPAHLVHTVDDVGGGVGLLAGLQGELLVGIPVTADLGDDLPRAKDAGRVQQPCRHGGLHQDDVAAQVAEGGIALFPEIAHIPQSERHLHLRRGGDPIHRHSAAPAHVDMGVDEAGEDGAVGHFIDLGSGAVGELGLFADALDAVALQHHGALLQGSAAVAVDDAAFENDHGVFSFHRWVR